MSPDAGWPTLRPFLERVTERMTIAMYDWSAPHVVATVRRAMADTDGRLTLVLDPKLSQKDGEITEDQLVERLARSLGDRFRYRWAAVSFKSKTVGGIFPYAYHAKVAVVDGSSFWLSSGNWQGTNQPDLDPFVAGTDLGDVFRDCNREWHVLVEHPQLARLFERVIQHDFEEATRFQYGLEAAELPDLYVEPDGLEAARYQEATLFPAHSFTFSATDRTRFVQPVLTPDNYVEVVTKLISGATESLYFQNQSFTIPKQIDAGYGRLIDALLAKMSELRDRARIILRSDVGNPRGVLTALITRGFDPAQIRFQHRCHTKGIIVDAKRVLIGSHNWTNAGTQHNRDASLLIEHPKIAEYFQNIFLHDWDRRARPRIPYDDVVDERASMPEVALARDHVPPGRVRVSWDEVFHNAS